MRKNISFTIAATILALTMIFWASASYEMPNNEVLPANIAPSASNSHPLSFQVLSPVY